ncbi:hypothetical protein MPSEU_000787000 [Mayamaea pseudoterrestris]|nr:hypothetical protein MPSEU_000787000 [Mayamaea pseudoterrestris]
MSLSVADFQTPPEFSTYAGQESFFEGSPPLSQGVGYAVVLGFGVAFSVLTTLLVYINRWFSDQGNVTSEHFNTAGRMIKTGLTASVVVSNWTWAATILQSSNVAWEYGVSGPFWYASGATIQVLLFGVLAVNIKKVAPSSHTVCEIVNARWGKAAHITFLCFCFAANIIVTSMLLLGGAATIEALTGIDYRLAAFLIPWGVILYTASGGLQAAMLSAYVHTVVIYAVLVIMVFLVYIKLYSSDQIYDFLQQTVSYTENECKAIFSSNGTVDSTFFEADTYACGPVPGNNEGSYLTMLSGGGLMFGVINLVGNFGTVFVDQVYWQSGIAARPSSAARGYLLGGLCWFAIPFSLATSLGLTSVALMLPLTKDEAGSGLVPPAVAYQLLGNAGSVLILVMLFMAITATGASESIAVASLITYDIYRTYFNPDATGDQILRVSQICIVVFGIFSGAFAIILQTIGLTLGWVYLFMGIVIGSAVCPLWNMMTWKKASGTGAVVAAWGGFALALITWLVAAKIQGGEITVATLGTNEVMLAGNLVAICMSGTIHFVWSMWIDPQDYDFSELDKRISLVEEDNRGLTEEERDPVLLRRTERWIKHRGYAISLILIVVWPVLSIPAGVFTKSYFAFWVLVSVAWGFAAAIIITILPLTESAEDINRVLSGMFNKVMGREPDIRGPKPGIESTEAVEEAPLKVDEDDSVEKVVDA